MAYTEDVNVNLNVLAGAMGGITAIMAGMSALTSTFGQFGTEAASAFGTADSLLVGTTVLLTSFGVKAAEAFGEFEQGMKIVQTVSSQSGAAIQQLTDKANEMSITYRTAIGDITEGLQTLGRAGLNSATTQLEVLESGLQTAKLEGRSLNGVLEELIQNTAMLGGDLKSVDFGKQTEELNSLMVGTSMTAPITSHDISQTLQYAGGTAAAAGANLESSEGKKKLDDLMGTIAAFAQKGVTGSMAGTALRAFFTKPASQDKQVTAGLERIGLTADDLWENGGESMKSVSDQIGIIQRQMNMLKLSKMDQIEVWSKIVGAKMGQQMMKLDSSKIKDLTRDIESAESAESLAAQTLQTYTQKVSELQQKGDLAFRELGEKAVVFLTPIVDLLSMIMGALSNPIVNTGVFTVGMSLIGHGIRKIWGMITAVFSEIKSLFGQVISGIETVNSLAGGSVSGFQQSANSVEWLNARLAETNTELAMMQAQFMKINAVSSTGTYVAPLGLTDKNGKLPANIIGVAPQKIFTGQSESIGGKTLGMGKSGQVYDQSDIARLTKDYEKSVKAHNAAMEKATKSFLKQHTWIDSAGNTRYLTDQGRKVLYDHGAADSYSQAYLTKAGEQHGWFMSKEQMDQKMATMYPMVSPQQMEDNIKTWTQQGSGQVHSALKSFTEKEYIAWQRDLAAASKRLNATEDITKNRNYYDAKGNLVNEKLLKEDQLKDFNRKYQQEFIRNSPTRLFTNMENGVRFYRGFDLRHEQERFFGTERALQKEAQLKQQESVRAQQINPQRTGLNERAANVTTQRLNAFNNTISKATTGITNFGSNIQNSLNRWILGADGFVRTLVMDGEKLTAAGTQVETRIMSSMEGIEISQTSFQEGLVKLQQSSGLTAAEFEKVWQASDTLTKAFLELYGVTTEDAAVTEADVRAKTEDVAATLADMRTKEADALQNTGGRLSKLGNAVSTVTGWMGGPFMAAMIGATFAMQAWQSYVSGYNERIQAAANKMSEATDKLNQAAESIKEIYSSENNNLSEADLEKLIDEQYGHTAEVLGSEEYNINNVGLTEATGSVDMTKMVTDEETEEQRMMNPEEMAELEESAKSITVTGDEHIDALRENTIALNAATIEYAKAQQKNAEELKDGLLGPNGIIPNFTASGSLFGPKEDNILADYISNNIINPFISEGFRRKVAVNFFGAEASGFIKNDGPVLDSYQSSKDYPFSTELAPIFASTMQRYGAEQGLNQFFGSDFNQLLSSVQNIDNRMGSKPGSTLKGYAGVFAGMPADEMNIMQLHMKNNPELYQRLGKQMFRYEQQSGFKRSAMTDYADIERVANPTKHNAKEVKDAMKRLGKTKLTVQDKQLHNTIQRIMRETNGKLSYGNVLAMGQLSQLQGMYSVATEQVYPTLVNTMESAYQTMYGTSIVAQQSGPAASGALQAGGNAALIAAMLGEKLKMEAGDLGYGAYQTDQNAPLTGGIDFLGRDIQKMTGGHLMSKEEFNNALYDLDNKSMGKYRVMVADTIRGIGTNVTSPELDPQTRIDHTKDLRRTVLDDEGNSVNGASFDSILNTLLTPTLQYAEGAIMNAYSQSQLGEYGSNATGQGGGGGGGDGGGSSGSNKDNSGTRKERVDLVLCNKKEIPKLNVNLFKKPPNFTVLNKNFRVRDIKISSQDKPKAIMNAVKNGIIETQKRMDPKIIQDEEAVYDPVAASDGKSTTPSGTTKTTTS